MAAKTRAESPSRAAPQGRKREIAGVVMLAFGLFAGLSLLSMQLGARPDDGAGRRRDRGAGSTGSAGMAALSVHRRAARRGGALLPRAAASSTARARRWRVAAAARRARRCCSTCRSRACDGASTVRAGCSGSGWARSPPASSARRRGAGGDDDAGRRAAAGDRDPAAGGHGRARLGAARQAGRGLVGRRCAPPGASRAPPFPEKDEAERAGGRGAPTTRAQPRHQGRSRPSAAPSRATPSPTTTTSGEVDAADGATAFPAYARGAGERRRARRRGPHACATRRDAASAPRWRRSSPRWRRSSGSPNGRRGTATRTTSARSEAEPEARRPAAGRDARRAHAATRRTPTADARRAAPPRRADHRRAGVARAAARSEARGAARRRSRAPTPTRPTARASSSWATARSSCPAPTCSSTSRRDGARHGQAGALRHGRAAGAGDVELRRARQGARRSTWVRSSRCTSSRPRPARASARSPTSRRTWRWRSRRRRVRIVAPIPGKAVVGIEVPNKTREKVFLKEILAGRAASRGAASKLQVALGKDIEGAPVSVEPAKMPHLLVAGTTGSGKSVAVNAMITSLLYNASPEEVRFIMVDPKMLELSIYEGIPHLLLPVVTDPKKANLALRWAVEEMERRYELLAKTGVRDIASYNAKIDAAEQEARRRHDAGRARTRRSASCSPGPTAPSRRSISTPTEITSPKRRRRSCTERDAERRGSVGRGGAAQAEREVGRAAAAQAAVHRRSSSTSSPT